MISIIVVVFVAAIAAGCIVFHLLLLFMSFAFGFYSCCFYLCISTIVVATAVVVVAHIKCQNKRQAAVLLQNKNKNPQKRKNAICGKANENNTKSRRIMDATITTKAGASASVEISVT